MGSLANARSITTLAWAKRFRLNSEIPVAKSSLALAEAKSAYSMSAVTIASASTRPPTGCTANNGANTTPVVIPTPVATFSSCT